MHRPPIAEPRGEARDADDSGDEQKAQTAHRFAETPQLPARELQPGDQRENTEPYGDADSAPLLGPGSARSVDLQGVGTVATLIRRVHRVGAIVPRDRKLSFYLVRTARVQRGHELAPRCTLGR